MRRFEDWRANARWQRRVKRAAWWVEQADGEGRGCRHAEVVAMFEALRSGIGTPDAALSRKVDIAMLRLGEIAGWWSDYRPRNALNDAYESTMALMNMIAQLRGVGTPVVVLQKAAVCTVRTALGARGTRVSAAEVIQLEAIVGTGAMLDVVSDLLCRLGWGNNEPRPGGYPVYSDGEGGTRNKQAWEVLNAVASARAQVTHEDESLVVRVGESMLQARSGDETVGPHEVLKELLTCVAALLSDVVAA